MTSVEKVADPGLEQILAKLAGRDGAQKYRTAFLIRRIEHRMRAKGVKSYQEYAGMLKDPFEHAALTSLFSVTVTEFFRDREFFELLKARLLPSLARSNRVKIWCAGCATGEEPYSIAILAQESLPDSSGRVKIFATDINPDSIRFAKEGMYEEKSLKNVPEDLKAKYFRRAGKDFWQVGQEILDAVDFEAGDLDRMAPPAKELDMILCRNVMIYFDRASRESLLKKFHDALKPQGYFVMGQSEIMTGKAFSLFKSAWPRERVYQKS